MPGIEDSGTVRSVERALHVIELLGEHDALGLEELHCLTHLPKATVSRLLHTLSERGWLYRSLCDQRYHLHSRRMYGASHKRQQRHLAETAAPLMRELSEHSRCTVDLSFFDGQHLYTTESVIPTCLRKRYPSHRLAPGDKCSLVHSAMGQACLAALDEADLAHLARSQPLHESARHLRRRVKQRGFGERTEGYWEYRARLPFHIRAIALPVHGQDGVIGGIALSWPQDHASVDDISQRYLGDLKAAVNAVQLRV